ncbi:MAG TPA: dihydropteroate synthase, partial [Dokdonella sp.]|nr:dihydropteroate synthase [Dokdonella sp.]
VQHGASIVRVHDVAATNDALKVWSAVDAVKIPELRSQAVGNAGLWEDD